jgi:hypothetical protein
MIFFILISFFFKAYSVRDEEVGYCQGLSFVIATLLIHVRREKKRSNDF